MTDAIAATYVRHGDDWYCVSTVDRDPAPLCGGRYAETIVWEWDRALRTTGRILHRDECMARSLSAHCEIVRRITSEGRFWEADDDDR